MPKFVNALSWQQAELLMQPVFIRVIANIGKQLEQSSWKGTYHDVQVWAEGTPEETKARVLQLQHQLETAPPEAAAALHATLDTLPRPYPGYQLHLQRQDHTITLDLWQLCYQICFRNYSPILNTLDGELTVEIDTHLIDKTGDVDWVRLDEKASALIGQVFASLPGATEADRPAEP